MKDESPNGLVMSPEPVVARMGRWPLYALLIVLILLLAALIYSVNFAHDPQKKEGPQKAATVSEEDKPVWLVEGSGLALDPKKDRTSGVMVPRNPPSRSLSLLSKGRPSRISKSKISGGSGHNRT